MRVRRRRRRASRVCGATENSANAPHRALTVTGRLDRRVTQSVDRAAAARVLLEHRAGVSSTHPLGDGDAALLELLRPCRGLRPLIEADRFRIVGVRSTNQAIHAGPPPRRNTGSRAPCSSPGSKSQPCAFCRRLGPFARASARRSPRGRSKSRCRARGLRPRRPRVVASNTTAPNGPPPRSTLLSDSAIASRMRASSLSVGPAAATTSSMKEGIVIDSCSMVPFY